MILTVYKNGNSKRLYISSWVSLLWQTKFNEYGNFTLELSVPIKKTIISEYPEIGDYIAMSEDDEVMIVTTVQRTLTRYIVSGFSVDWALTKRVSTDIIKNSTLTQAMTTLIGRMEPWGSLTVSPNSLTVDRYNGTISDGTLYDYAHTIALATNTGFKVTLGDESFLTLLCYSYNVRKDRNYDVNLVPLEDYTYSKSENEYANYAVVAGQGTGEERITTTVYIGETLPTQKQRREVYIDARSEQMGKDETMEQYIERLQNYGMKKLLELYIIENEKIKFYDSDLNVGDLFTFFDGTNTRNVPVIGKTLKYQNGDVSKTYEYGTPIITKRGK